jgi:hypothetical protein
MFEEGSGLTELFNMKNGRSYKEKKEAWDAAQAVCSEGKNFCMGMW